MLARVLTGIVSSSIGAAGVFSLGFLIYRPSADHARQLVSLGLPGALLVGMASLLMVLGGVNLILKGRGGGR